MTTERKLHHIHGTEGTAIGTAKFIGRVGGLSVAFGIGG